MTRWDNPDVKEALRAHADERVTAGIVVLPEELAAIQDTNPGLQAGPVTGNVTAGGDAVVAIGEGAVAMKTYQTTRLPEYRCPRCQSSETQAISALLESAVPAFDKEGKPVWSPLHQRYRPGLKARPIVFWPLLWVGGALAIVSVFVHPAFSIQFFVLGVAASGFWAWSWVTLDERAVQWQEARRMVEIDWHCHPCGRPFTPGLARA